VIFHRVNDLLPHRLPWRESAMIVILSLKPDHLNFPRNKPRESVLFYYLNWVQQSQAKLWNIWTWSYNVLHLAGQRNVFIDSAVKRTNQLWLQNMDTLVVWDIVLKLVH